MDTIRELTVIEATSGSMLESSPSSLVAQFCMIGLWFTPFISRALILPLLVFNLMLCFAAVGWIRGSAKERGLWRRPPTYPLSVPIIGHLLLMGWDSSEFMSAVVSVSMRPHRLYTGHLLTNPTSDPNAGMPQRFSSYSSQTCTLSRVPKILERSSNNQTCTPRSIDLFLSRPCARCQRMP